MPVAERSRPRLTQAERSDATRALLVDANIDCLIQRGYSGTNTLAVCQGSGV